MFSFSYLCPQTLADASSMLSNDRDARAMAGGMTLIPTLKQRLLKVTSIIDLGRIPGLSDIEESNRHIRIGAMTVHDDVARSPIIQKRIPGLSILAASIGDSQVRNRGTIGGSIANNDPSADYPSAVLALKGRVITNKRDISADEFFVDMFTTALEAGELVTSIEVEVPSASAYYKLPNPASRYATIGVFIARFESGCRVGVTGAAPVVFRWVEAEERLSSAFKPQAVELLALDPAELNSDMHATALYRSKVAGVVLQRAVRAALA